MSKKETMTIFAEIYTLFKNIPFWEPYTFNQYTHFSKIEIVSMYGNIGIEIIISFEPQQQ